MRAEHVGLTAAHLAVASVLSASDDLDEAAGLLMQSLGETLHWKVAHFWHVERRRLVLRRTWHLRGVDAQRLEAESRGLRTESLHGVLGRAMTRMLPAWSADLGNEPYYRRRAAAEACGMNACIVVPVVTAGRAVGALELFDQHRDPPSDHYLTSLRCIGLHIGEFVGRLEATARAARAQRRHTIVLTRAIAAEEHDRSRLAGRLHAAGAEDLARRLWTPQPGGVARALADVARTAVPGVSATVRADVRREPPPYVMAVLLRCVQELLANVHDHAAAGEVDIHVTAHRDGVELVVRDDGRGAGRTALARRGGGLSSVAEWAALLGGSLAVDAPAGGGVTATVRLPVALSEDGHAGATAAETDVVLAGRAAGAGASRR